MSSPNPTLSPGSRVRRNLGETGWTRTRALLSLGMVLGVGAVGTMAAWSDTATATTGMFETGAVNVQLKLNSQRPTYNFVALNKVNMARGASVAGMLPVNNTGSSDFDYTVKANSADAGTAAYGAASAATFAQNLNVKVYVGGSSNGTTCTGGTQLADTALALGSVNVVGAGRRLDVAQSESLCFQVTVNANAPKAARMSALSIGFQFAATQA